MGLDLIQSVFIDNLLPILLAASAGFVMGRALQPDIKTASRLTFYIFSPCLVFTSLVHVEIAAGEFGKLALLTISVRRSLRPSASMFACSCSTLIWNSRCSDP